VARPVYSPRLLLSAVLSRMNLVWTKLAVILACTMAGERDGDELKEFTKGLGLGELNLSRWGVGAGTPLNVSASQHKADSQVCTSSCAGLESSVLLWHTVAPTPIALGAWLIASLPTLLMRSRWRAFGIRACLWQILLLWLNLIVSYSLFTRQKVWGYVWALHAAVHTLTAWAPPRRVLTMHASHRALSVLGVVALCVFAWQAGPPVGLISWRSGWASQCGLSAHLLAVLGVDFVAWVLGPVGKVIACN
jgi:hypothetical protein